MTKIYECSGTAIYLMVAITLAKYIFLIPTMKTTFSHNLYCILTISISTVICAFTGIPPALIVGSLFIGLYIYITAEEKMDSIRRYIQSLKVFPLMGITLGILMPLVDVPTIFLGLSTERHEGIGITIYLTLFLSQYLIKGLCSNWYNEFTSDTARRKLGHWERFLLYIIGVLMLAVIPTLSIFNSVQHLGPAVTTEYLHLRCVNFIICFTVTTTVCVLTLRSSKSVYLREQMMQLQNNLIITMADIVENRDENTGGHIKRTAKYVEIIAVALKCDHLYTNILTDQYIADMIIAAPLHDIGKIHIPDSVLKKEGRYTEAEFHIMKSHTTAGKRLLLRAEKTLGYSSYLSVAVQMAGYHHEWWNGRGYPEGLKGQDIPLCARIMAVADVFDSLVSARCYKGSMTIDQAFDMIRMESGTHFDPTIAEAFLDARDEIEAVALEFKEHPFYSPVDDAPMAGSDVPIRPELQENGNTDVLSAKTVRSA